MNINLDYCLVDSEDKPMLENDKPVTAQIALRRAVINWDTKDKKLEAFDLFMKLKMSTPMTEFTLEEVALLDSAIKSGYPILFYGQLHYLLQGK
jgi:hypothetical protein